MVRGHRVLFSETDCYSLSRVCVCVCETVTAEVIRVHRVLNGVRNIPTIKADALKDITIRERLRLI